MPAEHLAQHLAQHLARGQSGLRLPAGASASVGGRPFGGALRGRRWWGGRSTRRASAAAGRVLVAAPGSRLRRERPRDRAAEGADAREQDERGTDDDDQD